MLSPGLGEGRGWGETCTGLRRGPAGTDGVAGVPALCPSLPGATHGRLCAGYYGEGLNAIIVFAACFLPDSSSPDYHYIMENLFL